MKSAHKQTDADFIGQVSSRILGSDVSKLRALWEKLDERTRAHIVTQIGLFIERTPDTNQVDERRERGALVEKAVGKQIRSLQKACEERRIFEAVEHPRGKVVAFGGPFWPQEYGPLSRILAKEILRLEQVLRETKKVYNMRRLGVAGKFYWLVYTQEFLRGWSTQQMGEALELTATHLAELIDAALMAAGRRPKHLTDPENIRKALANFRKNPVNQPFCRQARQRFSSQAIETKSLTEETKTLRS